MHTLPDYVLAGKPNSKHDSADGTEDGRPSLATYNIILIIFSCIPPEEFLGVYNNAQETPQKKYDFPQTEAQEIGWDTTPLVSFLTANEHCYSCIFILY